ncbi:hypothetical protein [Streptomyces sp. ERV7]|nr:hypothetical protein [Streptomyces sp. ERV7]
MTQSTTEWMTAVEVVEVNIATGDVHPPDRAAPRIRAGRLPWPPSTP